MGSDPGSQHASVCQARGSTKRTSRIHDNQCYNFKKWYKGVMSHNRAHMRSLLEEREGAEIGTDKGREKGADKGGKGEQRGRQRPVPVDNGGRRERGGR